MAIERTARQRRLPGRPGARAACQRRGAEGALRRRSASGGWHEIESEDGPVRLDLGQVVYVERRERRARTSASASRPLRALRCPRVFLRSTSGCCVLARTRRAQPRRASVPSPRLLAPRRARGRVARDRRGGSRARRRPTRGRVAPRHGAVLGAYALNTAIKLVVRTAPAAACRACRRCTSTPTRAELPERARVPRRSRARSRTRALGLPAAAAVRARARRCRCSRAVPRRALSLRRARRGVARDVLVARLRSASAAERQPAMSTRIGIVGMPNAGKSSLFNALTKAGAEAANYPFTTIEPNVAVVPVRDERLERGGAHRRRLGDRVGHDRLPRHRGPRRRRARGRGPRQPLPREHPRDRRDRARRAGARRRERDPPRGPRRPAARTSRRSRPSSCSPTSSRPNGASSASPNRREAATAWRSPRRRGCARVIEELQAGRPGARRARTRGGARARRATSAR